MKQIEMTVLSRDVDLVIEYLGRHGIMHFSAGAAPVPGDIEDKNAFSHGNAAHINENLERIARASLWLGVELPQEPQAESELPGESNDELTHKLCGIIFTLIEQEKTRTQEKKKLEETVNEAKAFSRLNAPFSDLDQLSYLTLRVGRLDPRRQEELRTNLADRAVIIPLDDTGRILAAASRKGRFALDSALKKIAFTPITIPEGYRGVPQDLLLSLHERLDGAEKELLAIGEKRSAFAGEYKKVFIRLYGSYLMARSVEELKTRLKGTKNVFVISGWVPQDEVAALAAELAKRTGGRTAIRAYNPEEIETVRDGSEKVPVSLKHGAFVKGFESVVFSYGAPLYGTLDPTPFVAVFFTLLFGIMFGDVGQGLVLLLLGFAVPGSKFFASYKKFGTPLKAVGISSMVMGFLNGEFFTNERAFIKPTRALCSFIMKLAGMEGEPPERILHLMPEKGNLAKLFYFFGFTVSVGILLNSIGLLVNIINQWSLKRYEKALFAKTGIAGLALFWYGVFIALRLIFGGAFVRADFAGIGIPAALIFFGPAIWRLASGGRPVLEQGLLVFVMEGFVEILESASTYISNTVSFLRVGAFALSHAVLSFIVFKLSEMVRDGGAVGPAFAVIIVIFGNALIILLEGMIVAIQVIRLQYYEFFSKFFTETGIAFTPFRFRKG
jgi:V/A-type H+-transporting ATPase subunit I